jgi:ligand-binding sensor domain-containing protein
VSIISSCNGQKHSSKKSKRGTKINVIKPENGFNCGLLAGDGNLWFGSNGGGVYRYNGSSFENYTEDVGLCNNQVYSIIEDKDSNIWFGTQNGLCRYDGKTFTHIPIPFGDTTGVFLDKVYPIISPNAVHSLAQDKKGNIWIGTAGGGAYCYRNNKFNSYLSAIGKKQEDSLYHNWIPSITEDTNGILWFASMTHGGVSRYDGEKFTQFMPEDGLSDDMVRTIYNDKSGKIWFGFNGNRKSGLTYYDGNSFYTYSEKDGLCNKFIRAIYEDKKGNLWLGGEGGLCVFDGENFNEFISKDGQRFDRILFIIEDALSNIWFGGKNGLWQFDGESVTDMTK